MIDLLDGKELYEKMDSLRIANGWSVYELAKNAGIPSTTIYNWRNRGSSPTLALLDAICAAFGITVIEFLLSGDELTSLTEEQRELVGLFSKLSYDKKRVILNLIKTM